MISMPQYDDFWETCAKTNMEFWTPELRNLSIPYVSRELTREEMVCIGLCLGEFSECFFSDYPKEATEIIASAENPQSRLIQIISETMGKLNDVGDKGYFIRLGSRSPKDSIEAVRAKYRCLCPEDAAWFISRSERVYEDISTYLYKKRQSHLVVRPWETFHEGGEFRCFVRDGVCVGISEYNYRQEDSSSIAINSILKNESLGNVLENMPSFVEYSARVAGFTDVIVDVGFILSGSSWKQVVVEINPFVDMTDPCLYDWKNLEEFHVGSVKLMNKARGEI
jgi:hypothetical protein